MLTEELEKSINELTNSGNDIAEMAINLISDLGKMIMEAENKEPYTSQEIIEVLEHIGKKLNEDPECKTRNVNYVNPVIGLLNGDTFNL